VTLAQLFGGGPCESERKKEAKTVEDALTSLQAYVRGQTLVDGGMGHEIRFEHAGKGSTESKSPKKKQKAAPYTVITLAN